MVRPQFWILQSNSRCRKHPFSKIPTQHSNIVLATQKCCKRTTHVDDIVERTQLEGCKENIPSASFRSGIGQGRFCVSPFLRGYDFWCVKESLMQTAFLQSVPKHSCMPGEIMTGYIRSDWSQLSNGEVNTFNRHLFARHGAVLPKYRVLQRNHFTIYLWCLHAVVDDASWFFMFLTCLQVVAL